MMKHKLNIFLASAAIALPVLAASLPFSETFDNGMGEFTYEDANNDGITFKTLGFYGYNYSNGLQYPGSATETANDWLFTPVMSLRAGYIYELSFRYKVTTSGSTQRIEWKAGTSAESAAMTVNIAEAKEYTYNYGSWALETVRVSVPTDGEYHLGLHVISDAGQGAFYLDEIEIAEGVNGNAPMAPEVKAPVFAVSNDALSASFEITLPSRNALGTDLNVAELTTYVSRDGENMDVSIKGAPGQTLTYTDPDAPLAATKYTFTCADGDLSSPSVEVRSNPNVGTPMAVESLNVIQEGNSFHLSWPAVTEATSENAIFIPSQVRYLVKCGAVTVADNIAELETDFTYPMPEQGQEAVSFTIVAMTGSRSSTVLKSASYMVGNPYAGEFKESFANRAYENLTWSVENDENYKWQPSTGSTYSPVVNPQDNDGGCLEFSNSNMVNLHIWSPMLDLSSLTNAKLKFWVYLQPTAYYEPSIQPGFLTAGEETLLGDPIPLKSGDAEGWTEFTFDLPESAMQHNTQLFFIGFGGSYGKMFVDNITIKSYLEHNLAVKATAPVRSLEIGQVVNFSAEVINKGVSDENNYTVTLLADGEEITTVEGPEVKAMSECAVSVPFKVLPKYADSDVEFTLRVNMESDMDIADNSCELTIPVNANELTTVDELNAEVDNTNVLVTLNWQAPEVSIEPTYTEMTESFETWTAGTIEAENGWILIDSDEQKQNGINDVNAGTNFAAMIAENFTASYSWNPSLTSHDGEKCLAITQLQSYYNTDSDNWVISPKVKGGSVLSFYAMAFTGSYGDPESFDVMWSTGGTAADDFTVIATSSAPKSEWTRFEFELPATASRFAIRVHGRHSNPVLFDSFTFTQKSEPAIPTGFNVYRDHMLLCTLPVESESHIDAAPVKGQEHVYHVTALYNKGESGYGKEARATVDLNATIETITDETGEKEYYTLDGLKIDRPAKGSMVIVKKQGKSNKVIIK